MKILLLGINAKYIHPNLAIRLLKKNTTYPVDIKEFTIKDDNQNIIDYANNYDIVGISCYIWNIEKIKKILPELNAKIILGGPEVSYNAEYYIDNNLADFVIKNEGEEAFHKLLSFLHNEYELEKIPNLYHKNGYTFDKLVDLNKTKMAYDLLDDVANKIMYIETSRGCPYKCGYCMASLDNKVRFFNINEIKEQILLLQNKGAKTYKFLDRTFNANTKFLELIDFIIDNHKAGESYQFEITGDLLKPEYIEYINNKAPKGLFRFEIGIQSTNYKTNLSVGRIQNNELLFSNIRKIQAAKVIDLHLDLIAGLPYEDFYTFQKTFNDVIALRPKELQLGFLKLLYGTRLYNEAKNYNYKWDKKAPYEIIQNDYLTLDDIKKIHICEDNFEKYYNSNIIPKTMNVILDNENNPFEFFLNIGDLINVHLLLEERFKIIDKYVSSKDYYDSFHKALIIDYLSYYKLRPKSWWEEKLEKKERNSLLRHLSENYNLKYTLADLYKYSILVDLKECYILALYKPNNRDIIIINK